MMAFEMRIVMGVMMLVPMRRARRGRPSASGREPTGWGPGA